MTRASPRRLGGSASSPDSEATYFASNGFQYGYGGVQQPEDRQSCHFIWTRRHGTRATPMTSHHRRVRDWRDLYRLRGEGTGRSRSSTPGVARVTT